MQVSVDGKYMHTLHIHSMSLQYVNVTVSPAGLVTSIYTQIWRPYKIKYISNSLSVSNVGQLNLFYKTSNLSIEVA